MPYVIPVIGYIVGALTIEQAIVLAVVIVASMLLAQNDTPTRLSGGATQEYSGTVEPRRIIYGQFLVSGMNAIPPWSNGASNENLAQILVLAGHKVNAITDCYIGQEKVLSASITAITGSANDGKVTTGNYANHIWIRRYTGTQTSVDWILSNAWPSFWDSSHVGYGLAYLAIQYLYDQQVYSGGRPAVMALVQGKICYDPRLDTSPGANPTNPTYAAWTKNAALCIIDFLTDNVLGVGEDPSRIDWTLAVAAANKCDELVSIPGATTQPRFTCNCVLDCTRPYEENLKVLAGAMQGFVLYSGGKWRLYPGCWQTPSFTIGPDDIKGTFVNDTDFAYKDRWNAVRGQFYDPGSFYQPADYPPIRVSADETADNDPPGAPGPIWKDFILAACTDTYEAQRGAIIQQRLSRRKKNWQFPAGYALYGVRPGETGTLTIPELSINAQNVRCVGWKFAGKDSKPQLILVEAQSSDYNDPAPATYQTQGGANGPAAASYISPALTGFTATGVAKGIQFNWTLPAVWYPNLTVELLEAATNNIAGASVIWAGVNTGLVVAKADFTTRYYWIRVRNNSANPSTVSATTPAGATSGLAGAAIQLDTPDYNPASVTAVVSASAAGPFTVPDVFTGAGINLTSVSVGPYAVATTVVLTFTGDWTFTAQVTPLSNAGILYVNVDSASGTTAAAYGLRKIAANPPFTANGQTYSGLLTNEIVDSLPASTSRTYYVNSYAQDANHVNGWVINNVAVKAEVIKA